MNRKMEQTESQDTKHSTEQQTLESKQLTLEDLALVSGGKIVLEDSCKNRIEVG
ncbi:hypothetical protein CYFUS_004993 [Cystobacter fuscus]|uniref:Uncharacterized protein n=1 Tax=Cystobacter fuscus TaxID=43 RepID=A0A250J6J9_9BACT|nr:hypothetical protein [Cystobacter fuscus]ATB39549.1 hypothetical protein CYFUS_004993 [Cystobacter fuscus]